MPDGSPPVAPSAVLSTIPALTKNFQQVPPEIPRPPRFLFEIVDEVTATIEADRLGVPFHGQYGGIHDGNPLELFTYVISELSTRRIAWLHLIEARDRRSV